MSSRFVRTDLPRPHNRSKLPLSKVAVQQTHISIGIARPAMSKDLIATEFRHQVGHCRSIGRKAMVDIVNRAFNWGPQNHVVLAELKRLRISSR
jgi:hypothetical protein